MKLAPFVVAAAVAVLLSGCGTHRIASSDVESFAPVRLLGCPPSLAGVARIRRADQVLFLFNQYGVSTWPQDVPMQESRYAANEIIHFFFRPMEEYVLPFSLGDALRDEQPGLSGVVLLQPDYFIALDGNGDTWLLMVRLQDSVVQTSLLRRASDQPPYDDLYWVDREQPTYIADDAQLHDFIKNHTHRDGGAPNQQIEATE